MSTTDKILNGSLAFYGLGILSDQLSSEENVLATIANITGYFPVLGTVVGIAHFVFGAVKCSCGKENDLADPVQIGKGLILRGIIEGFSLGFLLMPVDCVTSLVRLVKKSLQSGIAPSLLDF